jgi:hypothetical protein
VRHGQAPFLDDSVFAQNEFGAIEPPFAILCAGVQHAFLGLVCMDAHHPDLLALVALVDLLDHLAPQVMWGLSFCLVTCYGYGHAHNPFAI